MSKGDAKTRVPQSRYNNASYYSATDLHTTAKTDHGYFLNEDLGAPDTSFFSFTKSELEYIDPQQRQLLEVVRECFEAAGENDYKGKNIGCYVGSFGDDWIENLYHDLQMYGKYALMVGGDFALANRISYEYDLRGPNMSIRTACSSALVSLHEACNAIQRQECSAAVVAGSSLIMSPTMNIILSAKGVLSSDGSCRTFDESATGYGRGEAINAIYIKPLADAVRDNNPIRAIIRGTAVNSDGKTSGPSAPSTSAQVELIKKAYMAAGIDDISETGFFECHGTGTTVGDPIETIAVGSVFEGNGVHIGSVKPNIGHSEGASGLTLLMKAVMALEHEIIPPNIKFETPNPKIPFEAMKLKVPTEATPWPQDRALRASVNAFGMGGVNAHAIIESANIITPRTSPNLHTKKRQKTHLMLFSGNTLRSLEMNVQKSKEFIKDHSHALADLSYTLTRREQLPYRAACVISETQALKDILPSKIPNARPKLVLVFTGQGAQWPGMGAELYDQFEVFRDSVSKCDEILQTLPNAPGWRLKDKMLGTGMENCFNDAEIAQSVTTALQIGLVDVLRSLSVVPAAVIGHSSGEIAAAYAAEMLTAKQCIVSAFYRGVFSKNIPCRGGMAAVGLGRDEVSKLIKPGVVIACENSASSVTISGDYDALLETIQDISVVHPDTLVRPLKVNVAHHSHHMKAVGGQYCLALPDHFKEYPSAPKESVQFFSSLVGSRFRPETKLGPEYWAVKFRVASSLPRRSSITSERIQ